MEYAEKDGDNLLGDTVDANWPIYSHGTTSGALSVVDWDALGDGVRDSVSFDIGVLKVGKYGFSPSLIDNTATVTPTDGQTITRTYYYTRRKIGTTITTPERSVTISVTGATVAADVTAPTTTLSLATPANSAIDVAQGQNILLPFSENILRGNGTMTFTDTTNSVVLGTVLASDTDQITINGSDLLISHGINFPNSVVIEVTCPSGFVTDTAGNPWAGLSSAAYTFTIVDPAAPGSELPLPTPLYSSWDFDHLAVSSWDSDVTASTWASMMTAVNAALADQGTDTAPKYHRVTYTGSTLTGKQNFGATTTGVTDGNVFVLVSGGDYASGDYTRIDGQIEFTTSPKGVKLVGWEVCPLWGPDGTTNLRPAAFYLNTKSNARLSIYGNRIGAYWRDPSASPGTHPWGLNSSGANCKITFRNNDMRDIFETFSVRSGYYHYMDNFTMGLDDDGIFATVRGGGNGLSYIYSARNVICDYTDSPAYSSNHPDGLQTGASADLSTDRYYVECHQDIQIGDTYQQYPVHGLFAQLGGGSPAQEVQAHCSDVWYLVSGFRGIGLSDRRSTVRRAFIAYAPTGSVAVPATGNGWGGGKLVQPGVWTESKLGASFTPVFDTVLASEFHNGNTWAESEAEVVDYKVDVGALSGPTSYDVRFPNLDAAGMLSVQSGIWGNQWVISVPNSTQMPRTRQGVRSYISQYWTPYDAANGLGWAANGFNDPVNIGMAE